MDLMTQATQEYNEGKGLFMPNWKILLKWADMVKMKDANAYAQRKEEACLAIAHSLTSVTSIGRPSSTKYTQKCLLEDDAEWPMLAAVLMTIMHRLNFLSPLYFALL